MSMRNGFLDLMFFNKSKIERRTSEIISDSPGM